MRRTSFARGSELTIRIDFFSVVTFFLVHVTLFSLSLSIVCVSYYHRSAFISLHGSTRPNKKDHLLRSRDFVASTTVASRTLGSLHASTPSTISSVSISPSLSLFLSHEPPSLPSLVAHPSPNSRLLRIFREVLSSTLLNLERDYYDINFRQSIYCDPRREIRVNARTRICICVIVALCKLLLNRELEYAQPPGASVN